MDTTRDALAYDAFWDEWRKTHDIYQPPAAQPSFHAGWAAGVAEVERRYHNLVEAARLVVAVDRTPTHSIVEAEVVDDQLKIAVDILEAQLGAALASIDGAPR